MKHGLFVGGTLLCILGIALGLYVGVYWAFIGGIVQVIEEIRAPVMSSMSIAIGVVKVLSAGFIGFLSAMFFLIPGVGMMKAA